MSQSSSILADSLRNQGYAIAPSFLSESSINELKLCALGLVSDSKSQEKHIFSTKDNPHQKEQYFLDSAHSVRIFYEEEHADSSSDCSWAGINKIGHSMHSIIPEWRKLIKSEEFINLIKSTQFITHPKVIQSMYVVKPARIGGVVPPHQDATFLHSKSGNILGLWVALEDATIQNGCLFGLPDKYKGKVSKRLVYKNTSATTEGKDPAWNQQSFIPLEVKAGDAILFHGLFPHMSFKNHSSQSRLAMTLHMIDEQDELTDGNWLLASESQKGNRMQYSS